MPSPERSPSLAQPALWDVSRAPVPLHLIAMPLPERLPSLVQFTLWDALHAPVPSWLSQVENSSNVVERRQEEEEYDSEVEEEQLAFLLGTEEVQEGTEEVGLALTARDKIQRWQELQTQIKGQLQMIKEQSPMLTEINQLLILHNFANLCIKGLGHIDLSKHIALEWHKGQGIHFACQICNLACHYQKFQQLPPEK
jgi:hypothetical protein